MPSLQDIFSQDLPRWIIQIVIALLLTILLDFLISNLFKHFIKKTHSKWNLSILTSCSRPARVLVWVVGLSWFIDILWLATQIAIFNGLNRFTDVALIGIGGWTLFRFVRQSEQSFLQPKPFGKPYDPTTVVAIGRLLRIAVAIITLLVIFQTLGYSISGVLAFGGVGGLAIGFAAKDLLANFFGGLMIYMDRPFRVGDWIRSPDKSIEGTVEYIGWRQTRIKTFEKRPLYVPNSTFANISVENPSRMDYRRIKETIGLRYCDGEKVDAVLSDIRSYLEKNQNISKDATLMVNFDEFGDSSLNFFIYCFTHTTDWVEYQNIKQEVLLNIINIIHSHDADIAFPTRTLDIPVQEQVQL